METVTDLVVNLNETQAQGTQQLGFSVKPKELFSQGVSWISLTWIGENF